MNFKESLLHQRMAKLRIEKGWTQQQLAKEIDVTRQTCGNYESRNRLPDADIIIRLCTKFDVSADYLLGLSNTKKPEYAEIASTTGLTESSIKYLSHTGQNRRSIINRLLEDEPGLPPSFTDQLDPDYEAYLDSPEQVGHAYQEHLKQLEWEKQMKKTSILDHVANEWGYRDFIENETDEERATRMEAEMKAFEKEAPEITKRMNERYMDIDPSVFGPIDDYDKAGEQRRIQDEENFIKNEAKKSNLLTAIANYVAYTSGCSLETEMWSEELTPLHSINITTGKGNSIAFPSKQGDELLEFMLLQKVIEALKVFKNNYHSEID